LHKLDQSRLVQVATGIFDWLTLWWLASGLAWAAAFAVYHMVRTGQLDVPWLRMLHQVHTTSVLPFHLL